MSAGMLRQTVFLGIVIGCSLLSVTAWPGVDWATGALTVTVPADEVIGGKCSAAALSRVHSECGSMRVDRDRIVRDVIPDAATLGRLIERGLLTVDVTIDGNRATIAIPINGPQGLRAASRGAVTLAPEPVTPKPEPVIPKPRPAPPARKAPQPVRRQSERVTYTGIIIDAGRLGIRPAMAPVVRDANGHEMMAPETVDMAAADRLGFVGYARTARDAGNDARVGRQPLTIKAVSAVRENGQTVIVIPTAEAAAIRSDPNLLNAFRTCKVVIVTN